MAAIDIDKEFEFFQGLFKNTPYSVERGVIITKYFLADFAERVRESQMRSDIDFLHEQGFDEASSKLLLSAPLIEINKGDVK